MKKTTLLGMVATAAFVSATSFALAENQQPKAQQEQRQGQGQPATLGQEQIEGRIVAVDKTKGTLSVETAQHGQLEFKLTPAQVQRLSEGEQVRLQIQIHSLPKQQQ